ncbi:hypothetical protein [Lacinutrix venerupis]|uniref:Uncharacterized protein n=1 Tax=Lacinutrix venerupis TaxID=1486034 RepID=A0AAC9PWA0_9FLAO|nr:hypothetical protein [Lacinutrix venerupis]APX99619.1 hypothetical protein BWR22_04595 [Lacinutrix venerupis]
MIFSKKQFSRILKTDKNSSNKKTTTVQLFSTKKQHLNNLHNNLKQLEFISFFEMHLDKKNEDKYSLSFLQELEKIRHYAKINTLKSIQYCKE